MRKKDKEKKEFTNIEISDRHCPICGVFVKKGSSFHHCDEKKLNKLYEEDAIKEKERERQILCEDLTFSDLLDEAESMINPYLHEDEEEEEEEEE